jgi:hypothetical protein
LSIINTLKDRNVVEDEIYFYLNGLFCPYCGMQLRSDQPPKMVRKGLDEGDLTKD